MILYSMLTLREKKSGQSVIEAMVAVSVLTIGLLGIVALTTRAISEERTVADNFRASYLASEGVEIARNIIDANYINGSPSWNTGFVCAGSCSYALDYSSVALTQPCGAGSALYFDPATGLYSLTPTGTATPFNRCITITDLSNKEIRVSSVVTWNSKGTNLSVAVEDHFFDWRPR